MPVIAKPTVIRLKTLARKMVEASCLAWLMVIVFACSYIVEILSMFLGAVTK